MWNGVHGAQRVSDNGRDSELHGSLLWAGKCSPNHIRSKSRMLSCHAILFSVATPHLPPYVPRRKGYHGTWCFSSLRCLRYVAIPVQAT